MTAPLIPPFSTSAARRRGIMLGQAAHHFAEAQQHILAGLHFLDEAGFEPSEALAAFIEDAHVVDEAAKRLADTWAHQEVARLSGDRHERV